jgi:hypothetical protein
MKSITIDMADHVYKRFRDFLDLLPVESFRVYEEDPDELTASEKNEIYSIQSKIEKGDLSDFTDWEKVKADL